MFLTGSHDLFAYFNRTKLYHGLISNIWDVFIKLIAIFLQGQGRAGISPVLTGGLTDSKGQKRVREMIIIRQTGHVYFLCQKGPFTFSTTKVSPEKMSMPMITTTNIKIYLIFKSIV